MAVSTVNAGYNPFHDPNSSVYPRHGSLYAADDPTTPTVAVLENGDGEFIVAGCVTGMVYGVFPGGASFAAASATVAIAAANAVLALSKN